MKLNKRGERVFAISLIINAVLLLALVWWAMGHVWWVGDHYCFKTMTECYLGGK